MPNEPDFDWINTKDIDKNPVATFIFRCRSKSKPSKILLRCFVHTISEDLQRLLVIPGSPSIVPLEQRPVEELSLDEARELIILQQVRRYKHAQCMAKPVQ